MISGKKDQFINYKMMMVFCVATMYAMKFKLSKARVCQGMCKPIQLQLSMH